MHPFCPVDRTTRSAGRRAVPRSPLGPVAQVRVRYRCTARGIRMTRNPIVQATDWTTHDAVGPPIMSARQALTVTLTGWSVANPWSQLGILSTGTKADEMKVSGNSRGKDITCAVSLLAADSPMTANPQESE